MISQTARVFCVIKFHLYKKNLHTKSQTNEELFFRREAKRGMEEEGGKKREGKREEKNHKCIMIIVLKILLFGFFSTILTGNIIGGKSFMGILIFIAFQ